MRGFVRPLACALLVATVGPAAADALNDYVAAREAVWKPDKAKADALGKVV